MSAKNSPRPFRRVRCASGVSFRTSLVHTVCFPDSQFIIASYNVNRMQQLSVFFYTCQLQTHDLMPRLQSAYRRFHSTETALQRVVSDLLTVMDNQSVSLLALLDLSAAFDCVDHTILLQRLERTFGIGDRALSWISSFLSDRTQQVSFGGMLSAIGRLICGVPQGSVLGSLLFLLYTAALFDLISEHGVTAHIPMRTTPRRTSAVRRLMPPLLLTVLPRVSNM